MKRVVVHWDDAVAHTGQHTMEGARKLPLRRRQTIGWLVNQDGEVIRLAHDYDPPEPNDTEGCGHVTVIPSSLVRKVERA